MHGVFKIVYTFINNNIIKARDIQSDKIHNAWDNIFPHIGWFFSLKNWILGESTLLLLFRILLQFIRKVIFYVVTSIGTSHSLLNMPFKKKRKKSNILHKHIWYDSDIILKKRQLYMCYGHWSHELHFKYFFFFNLVTFTRTSKRSSFFNGYTDMEFCVICLYSNKFFFIRSRVDIKGLLQLRWLANCFFDHIGHLSL